MKKHEPIFISEDYSAVGRISLPIVQAIMAAFDLPIAALPSQLLSTQTEGFGKPTVLGIDSWQQGAIRHWESAGLTSFSAGLIGYIGDMQTIKTINKFVIGHKINQLIVDPVIGDQGDFYPEISQEYVMTIAQLVKRADIITPNLFELSMLLGESVDDTQVAIQKVSRVLNPQTRVLVTGVIKNKKIGVAYLDDGQLQWVGDNQINGHFYGTGDLFAALMTGYLQVGATFKEAVRLSQHGTYQAVQETSKQPLELRKFGMSLSTVMQSIIEYRKQKGEL